MDPTTDPPALISMQQALSQHTKENETRLEKKGYTKQRIDEWVRLRAFLQ
jgi:hypothetical protein